MGGAHHMPGLKAAPPMYLKMPGTCTARMGTWALERETRPSEEQRVESRQTLTESHEGLKPRRVYCGGRSRKRSRGRQSRGEATWPAAGGCGRGHAHPLPHHPLPHPAAEPPPPLVCLRLLASPAVPRRWSRWCLHHHLFAPYLLLPPLLLSRPGAAAPSAPPSHFAVGVHQPPVAPLPSPPGQPQTASSPGSLHLPASSSPPFHPPHPPHPPYPPPPPPRYAVRRAVRWKWGVEA